MTSTNPKPNGRRKKNKASSTGSNPTSSKPVSLDDLEKADLPDPLPTRFDQLELLPEVLKTISDAGWEKPSPIQARAIPVALAGTDTVGIAQTGTGKTGAFLIPILNKLGGPGDKIGALILLPTRELAQQVAKEIGRFCEPLGLRQTVVYGGTAVGLQRLRIKEGVDILVATPGRLLDLMTQTYFDWSGLKFFVLDEADRMLDMGFIPDIEKIMRKLPMSRQTMLFTATMAPEFKRLANEYMLYPKEVEVGFNRAVASGVTQYIFQVRMDQKTDLLLRLLRDTEVHLGIVFCKTKIGTDKLGKTMRAKGYKVGILHSDRSQQDREATIEEFRQRKLTFLVATDVASRGLDISGVSHVINYDVPTNPDDYIHRVGRTARNEAEGDAITLVAPTEDKQFAAIEKLLEGALENHVLEGFNYRGKTPDGTMISGLTSNGGSATEETLPRVDDSPSVSDEVGEVMEVASDSDSPTEMGTATDGETSSKRRRRRRRRKRNPDGKVITEGDAASDQENSFSDQDESFVEDDKIVEVEAASEDEVETESEPRSRERKKRPARQKDWANVPKRKGEIIPVSAKELETYKAQLKKDPNEQYNTYSRTDKFGEIRAKRAAEEQEGRPRGGNTWYVVTQ